MRGRIDGKDRCHLHQIDRTRQRRVFPFLCLAPLLIHHLVNWLPCSCYIPILSRLYFVISVYYLTDEPQLNTINNLSWLLDSCMHRPDQQTSKWLIFLNDTVLLRRDDPKHLPDQTDLANLKLHFIREHALGEFNG